MNREQALVELVDADGLAIGSTTVADAHTAPGLLHRAFSVLLVDPRGRLLLQQRAAVKTRFPLRWANACCGHPAPDTDVATEASRRLAEELGLTGIPLKPVGVYVYRALDQVTQRVEHEYDHVLIGTVDGEAASPDADEVAALRWAHPDEVRRALAAEPESYAPWLSGVLAAWDAATAGPDG
ncbi:isopentenyl-diphosphate Delta-isomerase [Planosporangium thailandense]|uniref:Isopentenyl-diphosphate Delta-isomerase n=1 Tax=Planosporangium thailandense TaxID=765197 RepID=A0ABX0XSL7_9ACTN|nr:isopentenyl-diphosphate Delta-isomerase [Planosporangium thailandense]NJC68999.1 isopentenyl-diphosphate Delta-isomerase [Planosporangium thailandense]